MIGFLDTWQGVVLLVLGVFFFGGVLHLAMRFIVWVVVKYKEWSVKK